MMTLARDIGNAWVMGSWENEFLSWINLNMHGSSFFNYFFYFITILADAGLIFIIIGLVFLFFKKTRRCGIYILLALLIVALLGNNLIIKYSFQRARPFYETSIEMYGFGSHYREFVYQIFPESTFLNLGSVPSSYSFVSGHTVAGFTCATIVFMYFKKTGIGLYLFATLIGFTRLFFGVHYPTDVIFGAIYATVASLGLYYLFKYLDPKVVNLFTKLINKIKEKKTSNENR